MPNPLAVAPSSSTPAQVAEEATAQTPGVVQPQVNVAAQPTYDLAMPAPAPRAQRQPSAPQTTPAAPRARPATIDGLPVGGWVVISRRATATDAMNGIAPGTQISVGRYPVGQIANYGGVEQFIDSFIKPMHVRPDGPDVVFVVEKIDDRGNRVREPIELPYAAPITGHAPPYAQAHPGTPTAPAAPTSALDQRITQLAETINKMQERTETYADTLSARGSQDIKSWQEVIEQRELRREYERQLADLRREREREERERERDRERVERERIDRERALAAPPAPSGFAGLLDAAPPRHDPMAEALTRLVDKITAPAPPAPVAAPAPDPMAMMQSMLAMFTTLMTATQPKQSNGDPMIQLLMEQNRDLRDQMNKFANPGKNQLLEAVESVKSIVGISKVITGDAPPPPSVFPDIVESLTRNADKIGAGLRALIGGAPQLPAQSAAAAPLSTAHTPSTTPTQPDALPPAPPNVAVALRAMGAAPNTREGDQFIINKLFNELLPILVVDPALQTVANRISTQFIQASSKPELRALVTAICKWTGDRTVLTEAVIERFTIALHRNYSFLFHEMTKQEKVLEDVQSEEKWEGDQRVARKEESESVGEGTEEEGEREEETGEASNETDARADDDTSGEEVSQ